MDIHAPHEPVHTLKDFGIHIAIVTIGILIALSLEGLRETIRDHRLVRDTRENFRTELLEDRTHTAPELKAVIEANRQLKQLTAELPELARTHPEQIAGRLQAVDNPGYFFLTSSWQTALSTSALADMPTEEVSRYAIVYESIRDYQAIQAQGLIAEERAKAFFAARPQPAPAELAEGLERIVLMQRAEEHMEHVGREMDQDLRNLLGK